MKSRYPLNQILEMRKADVNESELRLATALSTVAPAADCVAEQAELVTRLEQSLQTEQNKQVARMESGRALAAELIQGAAHGAATRAELKRTQSVLATSRAELAALQGRVKTAELELAHAQQKLAIVERHFARHELRLAKLRQVRSEEDATEAWQGLQTAAKSRDQS